MIGVLGISHRDARCAALWFQHLRRMGPPKVTPTIVVAFASTLPARVRADLMRDVPGYVMHEITVEVHERGYPGSASHHFVLAMTEAGRLYPGEPLLWLEADAIPLVPDWFASIESEYATCPAPFMGHQEAQHHIPHLAGVAVYPCDWKAKSPMLASSHVAPDIPFFGRGKGQAFDAYAAPEVFPQSAQAVTIQQVFGKRRWFPRDLAIIRPGAVLVHQSKDGSLINLIGRK